MIVIQVPDEEYDEEKIIQMLQSIQVNHLERSLTPHHCFKELLMSDSLKSFGLLVLRIGIGCFMLVHGIAKVQGYAEMSEAFPDPLGMGSELSLIAAIGAEVGCSILLILGLFARVACLPLGFTMVIAHFLVHATDEWKIKELSAVFLLVYVSLFFTGPGCFSMDKLLFGKKKDAEVDQSK
ncbi:MAG: DoxX family protein [Planctomycetaceae bacterium]